MRLLGLLFDNLGLKILALGMAWAVWFMVSQSLSDEKPVPLHLRIAVVDPGAVRVTPIEPAQPLEELSVTVRVTGPARSVADFQRVAARSPATIELGPEHYPAEMEKQAVFGLDDLAIPNLGEFPGLRAIAMQPPEVRVNVERMEVRDAPVQRPVIEEAPSTVEARIVGWDTVVKIRASAKHLPKRLAAIRTTVDADVLRELAASLSLGELPSITQDVRLTVDPLQEGLFELVDRDHISVRIELRRLESRTVSVPVRIFRAADASNAGARPLRFSPSNDLDERLQDVYEAGVDGAPPMLRLVLEGSPAAIAAVDPDQLMAFVLEEEMPAEDVLANLRVHIAGLPVGARLKMQITLAIERER